ncbi:MAG: hypothetical protein ACJ73E_11060 [Mycobacteriales bacterium]
MHGVGSRSGRFGAAWLIGTVLAVLAFSPVPAAASWTGAVTGTVSGAKAVAPPQAKRLQPTSAEQAPSVAAVLPVALVLALLVGLAAAVLAERARRPRSGRPPRPGRGPPLAVR